MKYVLIVCVLFMFFTSILALVSQQHMSYLLFGFLYFLSCGLLVDVITDERRG